MRRGLGDHDCELAISKAGYYGAYRFLIGYAVKHG
jgi:hypothetical protein